MGSISQQLHESKCGFICSFSENFLLAGFCLFVGLNSFFHNAFIQAEFIVIMLNTSYLSSA